MKDLEYLQWLHDRVVNVYGESENVDFLIRFRDVIKNIKSTELIIEKQDCLIGKQLRTINELEDNQTRRNQWVRKAKKEAGYDNDISFDVVWKETLDKSKQ